MLKTQDGKERKVGIFDQAKNPRYLARVKEKRTVYEDQ